MGRLSRRFGLSREVLRARMHDLRKPQASRFLSEQPANALASAALPAWDREVIEVLVGVPDSVGLIVRELQSEELESQEGRDVLAAAQPAR